MFRSRERTRLPSTRNVSGKRDPAVPKDKPQDGGLMNYSRKVKFENMADNPIPQTIPTDCPRLTKQRRQKCTGRYPRRSAWSSLLLVVVVTSLIPSYVISVPIVFTNIDESTSESRGSIAEVPMSEFSPEDVELSAKEFLGKFGYVKPAKWNNVSPRFYGESGFDLDIPEGEQSQDRKDSFEGSGPSDEDEKDLPLVTWSFEDISEAQYHRALIKYQRINGLNATGELDNDTTSYMGRPRCGVPDRTAAFKVNRTNDLMKLIARTTEATTSATEPPSASFAWINSTTALWAISNETNISTTTSSNDDTSTTHSVTSTPEILTSGDGMEGSGDDSGQDLSRRKRSDLNYLQLEAGFEELSFEEIDEITSNQIRARQVGFKELNDGPISEAELPDESRVTALEGILEALRQEKLSQMNATKRQEIINDVVTSIRPPPAAPVPTLVRRIVMESRTNRRKRSTVYMKKTNGWRMAFPKPVITWRLVEEWPTKRPFMISNEIWFTVKLAFRMWSEILPRSFREDNTSPMTNVDILLGFGKKIHNRCLVPFYDGRFTREYAHAWPLPQAEVHFNDDQPFVSVSWEPSRDVGLSNPMSMYGAPISLLKVATHEIGHTLGLPHNKDRKSVMNPVYSPYQSKQVMELEIVDRREIQRVYGTCNVAFDAVFDWVRQYVAHDGSIRWKYNTFFFRNTWFWLYENRGQRPRYGDPKYSFDFWRGVLDGRSSDPHRKIDGVVHVRDWSVPNGPIYFFTGDTFTEYDSTMDRVKFKDSKGRAYPRKIKDGFPGIPYPIDTVFYKMTERRLYFFKDNLAYKYDWRKEKVESIQPIATAFPGWGGAAPLPNNIDAAYYSYTDSAYYFFKGIYFWKLADGREKYYNKGIHIPENAVGPKRFISSKWHYICDVDPTEMQMTLPPEKT